MNDAYLRELEEALSKGDDVLHLLDGVDTVLDRLGVVGTGTLKDTLDARDVTLRPLFVGRLDDLERTMSTYFRPYKLRK